MNIINTLRKASEDRSQRAHDRHHDALTAHFTEAIQVKEFNGELYISVGGTPIVALPDLSNDIITIVNKARSVAVAYSEKGGTR